VTWKQSWSLVFKVAKGDTIGIFKDCTCLHTSLSAIKCMLFRCVYVGTNKPVNHPLTHAHQNHPPTLASKQLQFASSKKSNPGNTS